MRKYRNEVYIYIIVCKAQMKIENRKSKMKLKKKTNNSNQAQTKFLLTTSNCGYFKSLLTVIVAEVSAQKLKRVLLVDHNCRQVHIFLRAPQATMAYRYSFKRPVYSRTVWTLTPLFDYIKILKLNENKKKCAAKN